MPTTLLQDAFTDTASTNLTAHTMNVGPGWTTPVGVWTINGSNQAQLSNGYPQAVAISDAGQSDVVITLDCIVGAGAAVEGIAARMTNGTNGWLFYIESTGSPTLKIDELNSGTLTNRASVSIPGAPGTTVTLTVTLSGTSLAVAANTGENTSYTSSSMQTNTLMGMYGYSDFGIGPNIFDNFLVVSGGAAQTVIVITSGTTFAAPLDWPGVADIVECIGGGGGGSAALTHVGTGGGGGAYSKALNVTAAGGCTIQIGAFGSQGIGGSEAGTAGGDTWFNGANLAASSCGAKGGDGGNTSGTAASGGAAASGVGSTKYSGGNGGAKGADVGGGSGGGGAAGPTGAGKNGADGGTDYSGSGGGGCNAGSATDGSVAAAGLTGGAGGTGPTGTAGGAGGVGVTGTPTNGADGADGSGGGGVGSDVTASHTARGGEGGRQLLWLGTYGPRGGGGGGGYTTLHATEGGGGSGTVTGGGAGGGGGQHTGGTSTGGNGDKGLIVITYTPTGGPTGNPWHLYHQLRRQ